MNILITGAGRGIGFETALILSRDYTNNIIAVSKNQNNLDDLENNIRVFNPDANIRTAVLDLRSPNLHILTDIAREYKEIHVVINNAGLLTSKPFMELSDDEWKEMFDVNLFGPVKLIRSIIPYMGISIQGHIINIGSMGGYQGSRKFDGMSAYNAAKAGISNLTESLAVELKNKNIAVNCLALGGVQTDMFETAFPMSKAPLKSWQIAEFIADFCLNGHNYLNGQVIPVSLST